MRITGGNAARRILKVPKRLDACPSPASGQASAVFNCTWRAGCWTRGCWNCLPGSGALSLECLSQGAASALGIEKSRRHAEFIRRNALTAGYGELLEVRTQDVFPALHQLAEGGRQFDLILADPPYGEKNVGRRSDLAGAAAPRQPFICRNCWPPADERSRPRKNATRWTWFRRGGR